MKQLSAVFAIPAGFSRFLSLSLVAIVVGWPLFSQSEPVSTAATKLDSEGAVWFIPIRGDIEPATEAFIRREIGAAKAKKASHVVFEIDTFGGRVDTALQISSFIGSIKEAETVAWVRSGPESLGVSWSAGALIALSCSSIFMANGTSIGAAAPVEIGMDGAATPSGEKTVSAVRSQMAALAEKNGHPTAIALAMVDKDVELWEIQLGSRRRVAVLTEIERLEREQAEAVQRLSLISPAEKLLSLTAGEAVRYGLARGLADDQAALLEALGSAGPVVVREISFFDSVVAFLTSGSVQALLILLGLIALFLEINTPGFGIPGVVAIIAFLGVFGANALLGTVGSLELILFLVGVGLLAIEIFVIPGFGIVGISGIIAIALSLILSMQDFLIPAFDWQWSILGRNIVVVSFSLLAAMIGIALLAILGPKIRLFDRLTLNTRIEATAGGPDVESPEQAALTQLGVPTPTTELNDYTGLVGKSGLAVTTLRPSGKAEIDGQVLVVETAGTFLERGTTIVVDRVRGNQILVKKTSQPV